MAKVAVITGASAGRPRGNLRGTGARPLCLLAAAPASKRRDNLFEPVDDDEDRGAHGRFDGSSRARSPLLWSSEHRTLLSAGASLLGLKMGGEKA